MIRNLLSWGRSLLVGAVFAFASARAGTVSYSPGDLFLGVRATIGTGAPQDYLVNIGQASIFRDATAPITLQSLGNIAADLSAIFGPDWKSREDLLWSIAGTPGHSAAGGDPGRTLYATNREPAPYQSASALLRATSAAQAGPTNKLGSLAVAYLQVQGVPNQSTENSAFAIVQSTTDTNSYASLHDGASSYSYFSPPIEGAFSASGSFADLYRLVPASGAEIGTPGDLLGTFHFDSNGVLNFFPRTIATVRLESAAVEAAESEGHATLKVIRAGNTASAVDVSIAATDLSGFVGIDYFMPATGVVSFAPGETEQNYVVSVANRAGYQGNRQFDVALSSPSSGGLILSPANTRVTIIESEPSPAGEIAFKVANYQVPALNTVGSPSSIAVTLERSNGTAGPVSVALAVSGGSLINGTHYTEITSPTRVDFADGQAVQTFSIQLTQAAATALPGTIELSLSSPTGGASLGPVVTTTIGVFEGGSVAFGSATYATVEPGAGAADVTVAVVRTGAIGTASVQVVRTGGSATAGEDFVSPFPATITWNDGESGEKTFVIQVKADGVGEGPDETVSFALQNPTGGLHLATPVSSTLTILDFDDSAPTIIVSSPRARSTTTAPLVNFRGDARDDRGVSRVEVRLDGNLVQTVFPSGSTTKFDWAATVIPEQGANIAEVTAFDLSGNASQPVTVDFKFNNLRPHLAGYYNGLLVPVAGSAPSSDHHGIIALAVTPTGRFSGKVTLAGVTFPVSGVFRTDGNARFGALLTPSFELVRKGHQPLSLGSLSLAIDIDDGSKVTGVITNASTEVLATIPHADRAVYSAKANPVAPYRPVASSLYDPARDKGRYTALFQAVAAPNNGYTSDQYPMGDGFGRITLGRNGVVKIVGKLADGAAVSYANALSSENDWPVFVQLYGKTGFVYGNVAFDPTQTSSDAAAVGLKWFKRSGLPNQVFYPDGWANGIQLNFAASKHIVPEGDGTWLGVAGPANIEISATGTGLPLDFKADGTLGGRGKIVTTGAGPAVSSGMTAQFVPATGVLRGSFKHPISGRRVQFNGIALQKAKLAAGYFVHASGAGNSSGAIDLVEK